jgi:hypothetical protein
MHGWKVHIEIRRDNGPQFCAKVVMEYFREKLPQSGVYPSVYPTGKRSYRKLSQHLIKQPGRIILVASGA